MGVVEQEAKRVRKRQQLRNALLIALLIGGAMALGAAPRIDLLKILRRKQSRRLKYQINETLQRLARTGDVAFELRNGGRYASLTARGARRLALLQAKAALRVRKRRHWDKRWRLVIFDIPERRRGVRARLRAAMVACGFVRLQDSVWVYPYDCEELTVLLKAELKLGSAVLYMVVEKIENDLWLKKHFGLS